VSGEALERREQNVSGEVEVAAVPRFEQGKIVQDACGRSVVLQNVELRLEVGHQPEQVAARERDALDGPQHRQVAGRRLERGLVALLRGGQIVKVRLHQSPAFAVERRCLSRVPRRSDFLVEVHDRRTHVAAIEIHAVQQPHRRPQVGNHLERVGELAHRLGLLTAQQVPSGGGRRERGAELRLGGGRRREG